MYFILASNYCEACPSNCLTCTDSSTCQTCRNGYYGAACASTCPTNCKICNKADGTCTECKLDYYLNQLGSGSDQCVTCDGLGEWKTQEGGKDACQSCVTNCKVCDDECTCLKCNNALGVKFTGRNECETISGDLVKLGDFSYSGTDCGSHCTKCAADRNYCQTCASQYYLTTNGQCQPCPSGCTVCSSSSGGTCTTCSDQKYLLNGQCVDCTDDGQSISGLNCIVCMKILKLSY